MLADSPGPASVSIVAVLASSRAALADVVVSDPGLALAPDAVDSLASEADVVVIDMDNLDADAARALIADRPAVILWPAAPPALAVEPARAHLLRDADPDELLAAIHAVLAGLAAFDPLVLATSSAASTRSLPALGAGEHLTDREREVLVLLAEGLTNKAIARRLGISEHTAKFHVGAILSKLDAESRTEAVTIAARSGLLPL